MDIHISTRFIEAPSPELRRDVVGKAALLSVRLLGTFARMSEQVGAFTLDDAESLVEKLLYGYPNDVEWTLLLHRREEVESLRDFNAVLTFGMRNLRSPLSWGASFDLFLAVDLTAGREVIRRTRAEIALRAGDKEGLTGLASALDAHLDVADRAGVRLFLDNGREREILERVDIGET